MLCSQIQKSTTVIQYINNGVPSPLANGFFVSADDRSYLVTCRHVVQRVIGNRPHTLEEPNQKTESLFLKLKDRNNQKFCDYRLALFDSTNKRRWRSFLDVGRVWDVAILELDWEETAGFDIKPWTEEEFLPAGTNLEPDEQIIVFTHPEEYGDNPIPYDFPARIAPQEIQILAGSEGAVITDTQSIYRGASGSLVYRVFDTFDLTASNVTADAEAQLVGVFTGAPRDIPSLGLFHYIETAAAIIHSDKDCLDEDGLEMDDGLDSIHPLRKQLTKGWLDGLLVKSRNHSKS